LAQGLWRKEFGTKNNKEIKAKSPGAQFIICLPLADTERLSEDFVRAKYDIGEHEGNSPAEIDTLKLLTVRRVCG
jgi:hypothetical protein